MNNLRKVMYKDDFSTERKKGYFHKWVTIQSGYDGYIDTKVYALIETLSGHIVYVNPEDMQFTYHDDGYKIV